MGQKICRVVNVYIIILYSTTIWHAPRGPMHAPCFADEDSYDDDDIVEEVVSKRDRVEESLATEDDDEEDGEPMVTHAAARRSVQLLQRYFVE